MSDDDVDEFDDDDDDDDDAEAEAEFEEGEEVDDTKNLDPAARAARTLAIRRALEARMEKRKMDSEFNYLDVDPDE